MQIVKTVAFAAALSSLALTACSPSNSSITPVVTPPISSVTVADTLNQLKAQGKLPTLDTTTSVTGTDADKNGVRDDIDAWIAALPDTAAQKKALTQTAQAIQSTLTVDLANPAALQAVGLALNRGDSCIWQVYSANQSTRVQALEELSINTIIRLNAYEGYNTARNGAVVPALTSAVCN